MTDETKMEPKAKTETMEVVIQSDYWPHGKVTAIRGDEAVEIDIDLASPQPGKDARLRAGDVVKLPRKEAATIINAGVAKLPDFE